MEGKNAGLVRDAVRDLVKRLPEGCVVGGPMKGGEGLLLGGGGEDLN